MRERDHGHHKLGGGYMRDHGVSQARWGGYMRGHGSRKLGGRLSAVKREKYAKVKQSTSKFTGLSLIH